MRKFSHTVRDLGSHSHISIMFPEIYYKPPLYNYLSFGRIRSQEKSLSYRSHVGPSTIKGHPSSENCLCFACVYKLKALQNKKRTTGEEYGSWCRKVCRGECIFTSRSFCFCVCYESSKPRGNTVNQRFPMGAFLFFNWGLLNLY